MDAYKILGVSKTVETDVLRQKFRSLALELHPDKGGSEHMFNVLKDSYSQILKDIKHRQTDKPFHELRTHHKVEPVHCSDEGERMRRFHETFEKTHRDEDNKHGYGSQMAKSEPYADEIKIKRQFKKFTVERFNDHFEKSNPTNEEHLIAKYNPEPFQTSKSLTFTEIGGGPVDDFSGSNESRNGLHYTDYMKAYTTDRLCPREVKKLDRKNVKQLEAEREKVSFSMNDEEKDRYEEYKRSSHEKEERRLQRLREMDEMNSRTFLLQQQNGPVEGGSGGDGRR